MRRSVRRHRRVVALATLDEDRSESTAGAAIDVHRRVALHDRQIVVEPSDRRDGHPVRDQHDGHAEAPRGEIQRDPVRVAVTRDDRDPKPSGREQPDVSLVVEEQLDDAVCAKGVVAAADQPRDARDLPPRRQRPRELGKRGDDSVGPPVEDEFTPELSGRKPHQFVDRSLLVGKPRDGDSL